ncbi:FISUMP domain-containing protein [Fibrobacter sp. UBA4297]|uniref:FISUMP domain-containing protein n=1 Tax=Fibrobacter sp. UBA4297 TaxID=1946536 RepID=UPI0025C2258D|nr:FISUMP domain-containing protein [Fibrobacter sp. UBA4297]
MNLKKNILFLLVAFTCAFVGCGDDETVTDVTQVSYASLEIFQDDEKLPDCDAKHEKQEVFVKKDSSLRVCVNSEWQKLTTTDYLKEAACFTTLLSDKSGYKVMCNGDSVAVVSNGSAGKNGANGTGCSIRYDKDVKRSVIICGKDSVVVNLPIADLAVPKENPEDTSGVISAVVDEDSAIAISMDSLSGYSQKGPFVKGSVVYLYELQDGKTLKQTNGNFVSRIDSDDGHFKFTSRNLVSQYVLMQATGYYLNEVTNERTRDMITLNAITDISNRNSANVNVLTHLEYPRVYHLVTVDKMKFKAAKRQARAEILKAFHYDTTDIEDFEDLILEDVHDNVLRAISMLMQGDLTVAEVSERLSKMSADIEKDGKWDDTQLRAEIADYAYDSLRSHSMKMDFFDGEYGLPIDCGSEDVGNFFVAKNSKGKYDGKKFYCSYEGGNFSLATASDTLIGKVCNYRALGEKGSYTNKFWIRDYECTENAYDGLKWHFTGSRPSKTMATMTDSRDNKTYGVVTIGNQIWMAENLKYEYPSTSRGYKCATSSGARLDSADCRLYGRAYTWSEIMDSVRTGLGWENRYSLTYPVQGICPEGWHLPDTSEVRELIDFVLKNSPGISVLDALRSDIGWVNYKFNANGVDKYGFGVLQEGSELWTACVDYQMRFNESEYDLNSHTYISERSPFFVRCVKNKK